MWELDCTAMHAGWVPAELRRRFQSDMHTTHVLDKLTFLFWKVPPRSSFLVENHLQEQEIRLLLKGQVIFLVLYRCQKLCNVRGEIGKTTNVHGFVFKCPMSRDRMAFKGHHQIFKLAPGQLKKTCTSANAILAPKAVNALKGGSTISKANVQCSWALQHLWLQNIAKEQNSPPWLG